LGRKASPGRQLWAWELRLDQLLGLPEGRGRVQRANRRCWIRWRPQRAGEWAGWTWTLLWRIAVIRGVGAAGGVFGSLLAPRMGVLLGGLAATAAGRELRFRPSPHSARDVVPG
jgi:hypothetical protein